MVQRVTRSFCRSSLFSVFCISFLLSSFLLCSSHMAEASSANTPLEQSAMSTSPAPRILGVEGNPKLGFPGVGWVRLGYPTCGWGHLASQELKAAIQSYHRQGIRVLLTVCANNARLYDTKPLYDAARGGADAIQCGNEQMKRDASVRFLYTPPDRFAKFYDLCYTAARAIQPHIPVLLGSLDPRGSGQDPRPMLSQVHYLDLMQNAMNTVVYPRGTWNWRTQTLGLIDSWHNGYPGAQDNSLFYLFSFWAQQFHVNLQRGELARHLWVVEGTGCFTLPCGINPRNKAQVAVSHVLTLITDVQTVVYYKIPFFYFSGKDFVSAGQYWPIGLRDINGRAKPIRQDLPMGARSLFMTCGASKVQVFDQVTLLARLYFGCQLPANYVRVLAA